MEEVTRFRMTTHPDRVRHVLQPLTQLGRNREGVGGCRPFFGHVPIASGLHLA